ncbi:MAG TPA: hypothetical protein VFH27_07470 [Longimicrobiaceae bacterium]|nr:hypothetical protein [Longimicrobiaceae bacterium]
MSLVHAPAPPRIPAPAQLPASPASAPPPGRSADLIYGALGAMAFVFPSGIAARMAPLGLPGQAYEWALMLALGASLAMAVQQRRALRSPTLAALALGIAIWAAFLMLYSVLVTQNNLNYVVFGLGPYWFWMSLLVPALAGPLRSWRRMISWMTGGIVVAGLVGAYALFFNHRLLLAIVQPDRADIKSYLALSYRLPAAGVFIVPFLVLAWLVRGRLGRRTVRDRVGVTLVCVLLVAIAAAVQNRTTLLVLVLAVAFLGRKGWTAKMAMAPIYVAIFAGLVGAGFVALSATDPLLAHRVTDRFVESARDPRKALRGSYVNARDVLYQYSGETLRAYPLLGRGVGSVIDLGGGRTASMQDVTVLNHLDKSGLVGLVLFGLIHAFLYLRARRGVAAYREVHGEGVEYELRLLLIRYYPLILLTSLNIDLLYKEPFVIVHGLLMGSLLLEGEMYSRGAMHAPQAAAR